MLGAWFALAIAVAPRVWAQQAHGTVTFRVTSEAEPVRGARVSAGTIGNITNERGEATLRLPAGDNTVRIESSGLRPKRSRSGSGPMPTRWWS